jgi:hypothetical protein
LLDGGAGEPRQETWSAAPQRSETPGAFADSEPKEPADLLNAFAVQVSYDKENRTRPRRHITFIGLVGQVVVPGVGPGFTDIGG